MKMKLRYLFSLVWDVLCDGLVSLLYRPATYAGDKMAILLVKLDAIGDFILWLDAARELRRLYPADRYCLVLAGNEAWTELAEKISVFDEVIGINRTRFRFSVRYRIDIWRILRSRRWDMAIHPTYSRDFLYGDAIIRMSRARERVGSAGDLSNQASWQKHISDSWYTRLIPASGQPLMELQRNAEFMRGLGQAEFQAGLPELDSHGAAPEGFTARDYFVLVPGASSPIKQWPVAQFAQAAQLIQARWGWGAVVCGSPAETLLGAHLADRITGTVEDWTGRTSLTELVGIIRGAKLVIGNDSSAIHIAAAVGTPVVCIAGGWHWGRFIPYDIGRPVSRPLPKVVAHRMDCYWCNWRCSFVTEDDMPAPCVSRIEVDEVMAAVTALLPPGQGIERERAG